ncbi:hypothetical protein GF406_00595 [candidate division KSB1 bacterium]|jgi:hypothetical protein|nr:hypothetical protein [candidate division KSB1 bacterium]
MKYLYYMEKNDMSTRPNILDTLALMEQFKDYASPRAHLSYLVKTGKLVKVRRGLYLAKNHKDVSPVTLANRIYGPSYVSFEYALAEYGLIPERVSVITSASFGKNKNKSFETPVGMFTYQRTHPAVYPYGILWRQKNGMPALIASKEKALCDKLATLRGVRSLQRFATLLLEDLRVDSNQLSELNREDIAFLAPLYPQQNVRLLRDWLNREFTNA